MTIHKKLHVIFGTGPLAHAVMRELLTRDVQIRMVNRSGKAAVPASVEVVAADAYDPEMTQAIPEARETVEMMYEFEQPFVVDHSKYVQAFGNHATPLETAVQLTLAWYRDHLKQLA